MRAFAALAVLVGIFGLASPVAAGERTRAGAANPSMPVASLEALLRNAETRGLSDALLSVPPAARIAWLIRAIDAGGSSILVLPLVRTLLRQAQSRDDEGDEVVAEAMLSKATHYALYGYIAMRIQALLCSDMTSPDEYLHELGEALTPLLPRLAALDPASRKTIVDAAIALDDRLRPIAGPDNLICRRGQFADRFCPPGTPKDNCPENAAPWAEFARADDLLGARLKARKRARDEVMALARQ
jgi:hypothetical protein